VESGNVLAFASNPTAYWLKPSSILTAAIGLASAPKPESTIYIFDHVIKLCGDDIPPAAETNPPLNLFDAAFELG
jgi:hypothetical protein